MQVSNWEAKRCRAIRLTLLGTRDQLQTKITILSPATLQTWWKTPKALKMQQTTDEVLITTLRLAVTATNRDSSSKRWTIQTIPTQTALTSDSNRFLEHLADLLINFQSIRLNSNRLWRTNNRHRIFKTKLKRFAESGTSAKLSTQLTHKWTQSVMLVSLVTVTRTLRQKINKVKPFSRQAVSSLEETCISSFLRTTKKLSISTQLRLAHRASNSILFRLLEIQEGLNQQWVFNSPLKLKRTDKRQRRLT